MDPITAQPRFTFETDILLDGVGLVPLVMGLFGISEIFLNVEESLTSRKVFETNLKGILPNLKDWKDSIGPILRGSVLGFFLGILPGGGAVISSFVSYGIERKLSRHPEEFGKGAIAGVAGPESANNAATGGAFIPLLTLGLPSNAVMAILLGALMIFDPPPAPAWSPCIPISFGGSSPACISGMPCFWSSICLSSACGSRF